MTITSKFAGKCSACGCRFDAGTQINWSRQTGARHLTINECASAKQAAQAARPTVTANAKPIADFLLAAKSRGLKWPSVRFLAPGGRTLRLSVAGEQSRVPGSVQVKVDDQWIGRVEPDGRVAGSLAENAELLETLARIAADPATAAKEYGMVAGCCSFCDTALTDAGSVEVGYGPICAKRYGLPHTPKGTPALTTAA